MALTGEQKNFIKKYIWEYSPADIAAHLGIPEAEIHEYLKKRWRPEKYKKYINRIRVAAGETSVESFSWKKFIFENKFYLLSLFFLVFFVYFNALRNDFVSDDIASIRDNPEFQNISNYIFSSPGAFIQRLFYGLAYMIGGPTPLYFRMPNLIYHIGTVFFIFLIILILSGKKNWAFMTATLFAVHPILIESITWISGSPYALYGLFFMISFATYILAEQNKKYYFASLFFFVLAIDTSEKAVPLVLIFPLYEFFFRDLRENWKKLWPYFTLAVAYGLFVLNQVGERQNILKSQYYLDPGRDSLFVKIPTSVYMYFRLIFWPDNLSLYQTEMVFSKLQYFGTVIVFLIYIAAIIYFYKKNRPISFWLIFFIIPLLTTLTPLRVAWAVAERYAYLSTLGIIVFVAWIFYKISSCEKWKIPAYVVFSLLIAGLSIRTIVRNMDWKNEETLWIATEKTSPSGPNIHNNMGAIYQQKGELQKAIDEFNWAIKINPVYADAFHNLANVYKQAGKTQEALENYKKAAELNPNLWQSHQNLAAIYYEQGQIDLAKEEIQKAIQINPNDPNLQKALEVVNKNNIIPASSSPQIPTENP